MKNKALTYLMLIVVGVIWYQVFFRVKGSLMGEDAEIPTPNQTVASVQIYSRDTVELHVDYRDPFRYIKIAKNVSITPDESKRPNPVQVRSRPLPAQFQWPNVSYHGLIRNRNSKNPLGLVRVDGLVYNLRPGDEIFNSIYIKSVTSDSLVIGYKKLRKSIYRK